MRLELWKIDNERRQRGDTSGPHCSSRPFSGLKAFHDVTFLQGGLMMFCESGGNEIDNEYPDRYGWGTRQTLSNEKFSIFGGHRAGAGHQTSRPPSDSRLVAGCAAVTTSGQWRTSVDQRPYFPSDSGRKTLWVDTTAVVGLISVSGGKWSPKPQNCRVSSRVYEQMTGWSRC